MATKQSFLCFLEIQYLLLLTFQLEFHLKIHLEFYSISAPEYFKEEYHVLYEAKISDLSPGFFEMKRKDYHRKCKIKLQLRLLVLAKLCCAAFYHCFAIKFIMYVVKNQFLRAFFKTFSYKLDEFIEIVYSTVNRACTCKISFYWHLSFNMFLIITQIFHKK